MTRTSEEISAATQGHVIHWAGLYDSVVRLVALGREGAMRRQTVDLLAPRRGERILDVGCGTGTLAIAVAQREPGADVQGIDPAAEMVARARQKATAAGVAVAFEVGVIEQLPVPDESVDAVVSSLMLHHLPPSIREAGFDEILRVLRPGGRFVAVDLAGGGPLLHRLGGMFRGHGGPPRHGQVEELVEDLRRRGFGEPELGRLRPRWLFSLRALMQG